MLVHFPIVLAVLLPGAVIAAFALNKNQSIRGHAWALALVLSVALSVTGFIAMQFGHQDEEIVEKVVSEQVIEHHEEWAEKVVWVSLVPLLLLGISITRNNTTIQSLALVGSLVTLGLVIQAGHTGAELVYKHNAGRAHVSYGATAGSKGSESASQKDTDHDNDD